METKIFAKATVWREHAIGTLSNIETYVHSYTCTRERFIKAFSIIDIDAKVRAVMGMFAQGERTQVKISDFGTPGSLPVPVNIDLSAEVSKLQGVI